MVRFSETVLLSFPASALYYYYYYCITFTLQRNLTNILLLILLSSLRAADIRQSRSSAENITCSNVRCVLYTAFVPRHTALRPINSKASSHPAPLLYYVLCVLLFILI